MKNELTQEQIAQYRDQGFLMIEGFFNQAELDAWRSATEEAVEKRLSALSSGLETGSVKRTLSQRMAAPIKAVGDLLKTVCVMVLSFRNWQVNSGLEP